MSTKHNCVHTIPAACVPYEGEVPEWSSLADRLEGECVTISEVLEDIYKELTRIRNAVDVRDLGERCIKVDGEKTVSKFLYAMETKLCD